MGEVGDTAPASQPWYPRGFPHSPLHHHLLHPPISCASQGPLHQLHRLALGTSYSISPLAPPGLGQGSCLQLLPWKSVLPLQVAHAAHTFTAFCFPELSLFARAVASCRDPVGVAP